MRFGFVHVGRRSNGAYRMGNFIILPESVG